MQIFSRPSDEYGFFRILLALLLGCFLATNAQGASDAEDLDQEQMLKELKDAFRLYDREGNGYIVNSSLRDALNDLDGGMGFNVLIEETN